MRTAEIYVQGNLAGHLTETDNKRYVFEYISGYSGYPISLTMPVAQHAFNFDSFPTFFDGLLPEGPQLEGLLREKKIDRDDFMSQLITVGNELVGAITVKEVLK